eukprot:TRINITY_DN24569_c0_g2_i2.p2 TRINITY_DN24569_c0_g2~~TRINITY_DN24569_c0_g2_i2.p2  ORF type:complete len:222 (+),score=27.78 TRINITY_DN24569_c0_g2_i2:57-668(+)
MAASGGGSSGGGQGAAAPAARPPPGAAGSGAAPRHDDVGGAAAAAGGTPPGPAPGSPGGSHAGALATGGPSQSDLCLLSRDTLLAVCDFIHTEAEESRDRPHRHPRQLVRLSLALRAEMARLDDDRELLERRAAVSVQWRPPAARCATFLPEAEATRAAARVRLGRVMRCVAAALVMTAFMASYIVWATFPQCGGGSRENSAH